MGECITLSHNNAVHFNGVTVVIEVAFSDARIVSMRFRLARLVSQSEPAFSLAARIPEPRHPTTCRAVLDPFVEG